MKREVKGNVTMTLGEYNEIFATLLKYESALKIRKGYNGNDLECEFDFEAIRDIIEEKKEDFKDNKKFIIAENFSYKPSITIASLKELEGDN